MKRLILLSLILVSVYGHSWLTSPPAAFLNNTPQASTVAVCGQGTFPGFYQTAAGGSVPVNWANNGHDSSTDPVYLNLLYLNYSTYMDLVSLPYTAGSGASPYQLQIPITVLTGQYVLQWWWSSWYCCAELNVTGSDVFVTLLSSNLPLNEPASTNYTYFDYVSQTNTNFLSVTLSGPTGATYLSAYVSADGNPSSHDYLSSANTSQTGSVTFGVCNDGDYTTYTMAVVGTAGISGSTFTIQAMDYSGVANIDTPVITAQPHTGYMYYETGAYQTFDTQRRTVIDSTGNIGIVYPMMGYSCNNTNITSVFVGSSKACFQLSTNPNIKYIRVPPQTSQYTVFTEVGACSNLSEAVPQLKVAMTLVIFLVIILITL